MENRKLIVTSEIINALIDKNGGPIKSGPIFEMVKERTGVKEEKFGGEIYNILFLLSHMKFLKCSTYDSDGKMTIEADTEFIIGPNWNDATIGGIIPQSAS